jgi:hypothetical protein
MNPEHLAQLRAKAALLDQQAMQWIKRVPVKARILLGLFFLAAVLMAIHTALTAKDASLHLKLQHGFRSAQLSVWVDDDLAFAGTITGATKKKFGLIPTDAQQGNFSQIIAIRSAGEISVCASSRRMLLRRKTASPGILQATPSVASPSPPGKTGSPSHGREQEMARPRPPPAFHGYHATRLRSS